MPLAKKDQPVVFRNHSFKAEEVDKTEGNQGRIVGLSAAFNNVDSYNEVIRPGAFLKTIKKNPNWKVLRFHDPSRPIGLSEDPEEASKGLKTTSLISLDTQDGVEQFALSKLAFTLDKAIDAQSIGFIPLAWEVEEDKKKGRIKFLTEIDMWEHSFVTWGANPKAFSTGFKQWSPNESEGYGLKDHVDDFFKFMEGLGYKHDEIKTLLIKDEYEEQEKRTLELMNETINIFKG